MEKPPSREPPCVGTLEIARPKPVGFLCGSIPVSTDQSFHEAFNTAIVPSHRTKSRKVSAPRYRMLPTETDLNRPPLVPNLPDKVLPVGIQPSKTTGDISWEGGPVAPNLHRKCEALAVSGLVEYGDEIDVIAPVDILKQIFKIPYSKARVSIAVHRVGQTLVLNTGADIEEGERLARRHGSQSKSADQSLFLNFAMHSVRMEACDCPPTHHAPSERQSSSSVLPGGETSNSQYPQVKQEGFIWGGKKNKRNKSRDTVKKTSHAGEKPGCSIQDSEKHKRLSNDGFLRVLFWQFHNFRMLLGSDLLLFSNEKYLGVSLHLWDVTRQVTPLTWLEAWLDNVMASVPELAICYHENGVVQGYELLKTDDIFLLKGISDDGTPAFHPHVVQQNGLSVLRFLQKNCTHDPGVYWLYKSAGEDVIQLFDLSVIPKNHSSGACDDSSSSLPTIYKGRSDSFLSLGTLLYRIAHRLSLSMAPEKRAKCASFFKKCLECLDEPDHLVVRAFAHEQFARLILGHEEDLEFTSESLPIKYETKVTGLEEESMDPLSSFSEQVIADKDSLLESELSNAGISVPDIASEVSVKMMLEAYVFGSRKSIPPVEPGLRSEKTDLSSSTGNESFALCEVSPTLMNVVQTVADPISLKLAAIHHVSQAIKSLRWRRQLQGSDPELVHQGIGIDNRSPSVNLSLCACGDADCIEVCDIREWLPTSNLDHKLWKLVLLLGESYLALGQAYKEDGQLHQALRIVKLACSVYGSMPRHLQDTKFISSITRNLTSETRPLFDDMEQIKTRSNDNCPTLDQLSSTSLFWARAWTLVGDVYVEFHVIKGKVEIKHSTRELRMSSEVVKEVKRLKNKLGQHNQNCSSCSLVNCSCQSDRASSGSSASSSSGDNRAGTHGRKLGKKSHAKSGQSSLLEDTENAVSNLDIDSRECPDNENRLHDGGEDKFEESLNKGSFEIHNAESEIPKQSKTASNATQKLKNGGIFRYIEGPVVGDAEHNLAAALNCYEEARKSFNGLPTVSAELQSILKKKGWVFNELGRIRLERKEMIRAEHAFAHAINAFRQVSDHTNIILINCNLGHGRRALAEELVSKVEGLKLHPILHNVYKQALVTVKHEYSESLRYYGAAKLELNYIVEGDSMSDGLRNEVFTQYAHTYLKLGMFLAREDTTAEIYDNGTMEDTLVAFEGRTRKEVRKHEISANDAIREALSVYETLGDVRKQEAAYAYFQLACYQRDCCLKFVKSDDTKKTMPKGESTIFHKVKVYASLAERNWQKAMDFYGPKSHPTMYLTILLERSALSFQLSGILHSNAMLESSLSRLLDGRHISEASPADHTDIHAKFWNQLQLLLKKMLAMALSSAPNRSSSSVAQPNSSHRSGDAGKLRQLYKMSLESTDFSKLHDMHTLWTP